MALNTLFCGSETGSYPGNEKKKKVKFLPSVSSQWGSELQDKVNNSEAVFKASTHVDSTGKWKIKMAGTQV